MLKIKILAPIIALAALILGGCIPKTTAPKYITCPVPEQDCQPGEWAGIAVDTSLEYAQVADWYYVFETVKKINSPEDEWALSFISPQKAVLTFTDADKNRVMLVRMPRENVARMESGIGVPAEGNIGAFSIRDNFVMLAFADNKPMIGNSDIYSAELSGNILTDFEKLPENLHQNVSTWESHPSLSPDGNVLFFSSDRVYQTGELDLWFSVKISDGVWSAPINCGSAVNSGCDEITPFASPDGKELYFASSGHKTVGGYDIFVSKISPTFWTDAENGNIDNLKNGAYFSKAENLRPPLNTPADELFPSSPGNPENLLYYSSNQDENLSSILSKKGGFDLYLRKKIKKYTEPEDTVDILAHTTGPVEFNPDENFTPETIDFGNFTVTGQIFNATTKKPAENARVSVREIQGWPPGISLVYQILTDTTGKYKVSKTDSLEYKITTTSATLMKDTFKINVEKGDTLIVADADKTGRYSVELAKDREYELTAQSQELFFESFRLRVNKGDTTTIMEKSFYVPELLTLRINFPTAKYDQPYKYSLDSMGVETYRTWQEELNLLSQNIIGAKEKFKKIILIGHTDDVGSVGDNKILGRNRVNFVINELVKRGVPRGLLEGRSAGELEPLERRKGESLEMYRKRLRRVELRKVQ